MLARAKQNDEATDRATSDADRSIRGAVREDVILGRVAQLRAEGRRRRRLMQVPSIGGGALLACVGFAMTVAPMADGRKWLQFVGFVCVHVGLWLALLALRPQDRQSVRAVCAIGALFPTIAFVIEFPRAIAYAQRANSLPARFFAASSFAIAATCALACSLWLRAVIADVFFGASPRVTLQRSWEALGCAYLLTACSYHTVNAAIALVVPSRETYIRAETAVAVPLIAVALGLGCSAFWGSVRSSVQEMLARIGEGVSSAAGIAELIGGLPPDEVLARARATFRALPASALTLEHLTVPHDQAAKRRESLVQQHQPSELIAKSAPPAGSSRRFSRLAHRRWSLAAVSPERPADGCALDIGVESAVGSHTVSMQDANSQLSAKELLAMSSPVQLGSVDAFISHSWRDDPQLKLAAIQRWRHGFMRAHGREPTVWFDRLCIDQDNILAQLPALPVYLAGCKNLIALQGPTYFQRLWCVLELHIFHQMGGSLDQTQFIHIDAQRELRTASSVPETQIELEPRGAEPAAVALGFNVNDAQTSDPLDQTRLLAVIEGGGGGIAAFNEWMRSMLLLAEARHERSATRG
ncbi:hypothetical protein KFE25_005792 [Diacronema lutheri]|uniref:Uncharacterized protein n=1 Tax=Diacronema lutheri TaxID=2081491 RepID=A0A8J6C1Q8_DIALT|nr:hypothetical protein KFE25_005792 [Diacronema lutheri]